MHETLIELTRIVENTLGITLNDGQRDELIYFFEEPVTSVAFDAHLNGMKIGKEKGIEETLSEVFKDVLRIQREAQPDETHTSTNSSRL